MEMVAVPAALARALGIAGSATGMQGAPAGGKGGKGGKGGGKGFQPPPQNGRPAARPTPSYAELKEVNTPPSADFASLGIGEKFAIDLGAGPGRRENPLKAP